ncbi:conserved Plasmodium protein, unknown function [Plasmodium ovale wallikeri]|uniref:Uncharacterized protein n=1 Tax=Plasmodium ovale wallikeri TaxID=864142 RepID=A0A1A8Z3S0_PLAOA|nr:conserved Plasmodium protein, unknown function [Plasmodium ovale wallikeri]
MYANWHLLVDANEYPHGDANWDPQGDANEDPHVDANEDPHGDANEYPHADASTTNTCICLKITKGLKTTMGIRAEEKIFKI